MDITPSTLQPNLIPITAEDLNIQEGMAIDGTPAANTPATPAADLNIKVSANGSVMSIGNLQSTNFSAGSAGWRLDSNGNIEANDGNFRGDITGATGTFTGTVSIGSLNIPDEVTADSFHVDTTGNAWWGATTIGSAVAKIEKDGSALFASITATGTINAQAGYLSAGVYIDSATAIACESAGINVGVLGHVRGGATDYLTGTGFWLGYDTTAYKFSVGDPSGKYLAWDGTQFVVNGFVLSGKGAFGGDGSDGALSISSGNTEIDLGSVATYEKNYTSISITGTAYVTFINPHANGSIVILKCSGDVTITSSATQAISVIGMGANTATIANSTTIPAKYGVTSGNQATGSNGAGGVGGIITSIFAGKSVPIGCGAGGTNGGRNGGTGGNGGGGLLIECNGALNITGNMSSNGVVGGASSGYGGGGGGGGGGAIVILYNTLTANTSTFTATGGNGGNGERTAGGAGGVGISTGGGTGVGGIGGLGVNQSYGGGGGGGGGNGGNTGATGAGANLGGAGGGGGGGLWVVAQNKYFV